VPWQSQPLYGQSVIAPAETYTAPVRGPKTTDPVTLKLLDVLDRVCKPQVAGGDFAQLVKDYGFKKKKEQWILDLGKPFNITLENPGSNKNICTVTIDYAQTPRAGSGTGQRPARLGDLGEQPATAPDPQRPDGRQRLPPLHRVVGRQLGWRPRGPGLRAPEEAGRELGRQELRTRPNPVQHQQPLRDCCRVRTADLSSEGAGTTPRLFAFRGRPRLFRRRGSSWPGSSS